MTALVVRSDARCLPLAEETVDLVVTSPPYFGLRSYKDGGEHYDGQIGAEATPAEFVDALLDVTRECLRVLKPTGSLWVNLGDKYARNGGGGRGSSDGLTKRGPRPSSTVPAGIREKSLMGLPWRYALACIDQLGLILRSEIIWSKPNGLPESVTDRARRTHEQWFHFVTQPTYYADMDATRQPYEGVPQRRIAARIKDRRAEGRPVSGWDVQWDEPKSGEHPLGKLPSSVWSVPPAQISLPAELGVQHFAAFPTEWPRRIISGWSPLGGVVLDPFSGTGTTAMVASALGRVGIGLDLSWDYCRVGAWRVKDPAQRAKALNQSSPAEQVAGQADLFEESA